MNVDRLLENNALPFAAPLRMTDEHGFDVVVVVARLAWQVSALGEARLAEPQRPIRINPVHHLGAASSLRFPSDHQPSKPGTDLLVLGRAYPPSGQSVTQLDVSVRLETGSHTLHKKLRVHGPRVFMKRLGGVAPGPARPFDHPVPLVYELAEGGRDPLHPDFSEPTNPVGLGKRKNRLELLESEAPRIELLGGDKPAGFGAIAPHWSPRAEWFGTTDGDYAERRHPVAPEDFDPRHFSDAHPDLWSETPLRGDEPIELLGLTPEGQWRFKLPPYQPRFDSRIDGESQELPSHLDTILIDVENPAERIVELTWRAKVRLPRKSERLQAITLTDKLPLPRPHALPADGSHDQSSLSPDRS